MRHPDMRVTWQSKC